MLILASRSWFSFSTEELDPIESILSSRNLYKFNLHNCLDTKKNRICSLKADHLITIFLKKNNQARRFFPILLLFRMKENLRIRTDPFSLATVRMSSSKCIFHFVSHQTALVWTSSINLNYIQTSTEEMQQFL